MYDQKSKDLLEWLDGSGLEIRWDAEVDMGRYIPRFETIFICFQALGLITWGLCLRVMFLFYNLRGHYGKGTATRSSDTREFSISNLWKPWLDDFSDFLVPVFGIVW